MDVLSTVKILRQNPFFMHENKKREYNVSNPVKE